MAQKRTDKRNGGDTRPFTSVNYSAARRAREQQRRELEQQKKERLIFVLFVVIIIVMILFAVLIFKKFIGGTPSNDTESQFSDTEGNIDLADYDRVTVAKSDIQNGHLLLIDGSHSYRGTAPVLGNIHNADNRAVEGEKTPSGKQLYTLYTGNDRQTLEKETLAALLALARDFYKATGNYDLYVDADGSYDENASDDHATGRAVDISVYTGSEYYDIDDPKASEDFRWVLDNYHKYGFILNASCNCTSGGSHHLLYVGLPHAAYMREHDMTLAEYWQTLAGRHGAEAPLSITTAEGSYLVYYVAAEGDEPVLSVPKGADYSLSGDNQGGFAVTLRVE